MNTNNKVLQVLLVEDSPEDVFFFERALRKSGVEVNLTTLIDGQQAVEYLDKAENQQPDLVFLDLKLPFLTGFDVLRWMGTKRLLPQLRVIILSGSSHEKDQVLAAELGATEYLVKPISPETLRSRLLKKL